METEVSPGTKTSNSKSFTMDVYRMSMCLWYMYHGILHSHTAFEIILQAVLLPSLSRNDLHASNQILMCKPMKICPMSSRCKDRIIGPESQVSEDDATQDLCMSEVHDVIFDVLHAQFSISQGEHHVDPS